MDSCTGRLRRCVYITRPKTKPRRLIARPISSSVGPETAPFRKGMSREGSFRSASPVCAINGADPATARSRSRKNGTGGRDTADNEVNCMLENPPKRETKYGPERASVAKDTLVTIPQQTRNSQPTNCLVPQESST